MEVWERLQALDRLETSGRRQRIVLHATGARFEVRLPLAARGLAAPFMVPSVGVVRGRSMPKVS